MAADTLIKVSSSVASVTTVHQACPKQYTKQTHNGVPIALVMHLYARGRPGTPTSSARLGPHFRLNGTKRGPGGVKSPRKAFKNCFEDGSLRRLATCSPTSTFFVDEKQHSSVLDKLKSCKIRA